MRKWVPWALVGIGAGLRAAAWWWSGDFTFDELGVVGQAATSERTLRLGSLVASVGALPLMYGVGRRWLGEAGGVMALAVLVFLGPAIGAAAEVSTAAVGMLVTLAVLWAYGAKGWRWAAIGVGGGLFLGAMDWGAASDAMMPWSRSAVPWVASELMAVFLGRMGWPVVGFVAWGVGVATIAVVRPRVLWLVLAPLLLLFVGAGVHEWGIGGVSFLVPVVGLGMAGVMLRNQRSPVASARVRRVVLAGLVGGVIAAEVMGSLVSVGGKEEISVVLRQMANQVRDGDEIYVYHGAERGVDHYAERCGISAGRVVRGRDREKDYYAFEQDVAEMRGRVWVVFSHVPGGLSRDGRLMGLLPKEERAIVARGAGAYLVEVGETRQTSLPATRGAGD